MILTLVIIVLCILIGWMEYNNRLERSKFLNALISKNIQDVINLELTDKTKPIDPKNQPRGDELVSMDDLDDEEFMKAIKP
jgi:hypothetical protein